MSLRTSITRKRFTCNARFCCRFFSSSLDRPVHIDHFTHEGGVDAEPLHRYRPGGYHPVLLGDVFKNGRYKILHKLGWGGHSTVWAARDQREQQYVALKIAVSDSRTRSRELQIMSALAGLQSKNPGSQHIMSMLDHFQLEGPNGTHDCLELELLGQNVPDLLERRYADERLPGKLAKSIAKQALLGLDYLHQHNIAHGDLHTRNLVFTIPKVHSLSEEDFLRKLRAPETDAVRRKDGRPLETNIPEYLICPTSYPLERNPSPPPIKIVDFGESFMTNDTPSTLHTPLVVRAPEVIFKDRFDHRVDLWSMGCTLFELVAGQPPFTSSMINPTSLVEEMRHATGEHLPKRWQPTWRAMQEAYTEELDEPPKLENSLEEIYFDTELNRIADIKDGMTRGDILKVGELVRKLLRFEPEERVPACEILRDPWFGE